MGIFDFFKNKNHNDIKDEDHIEYIEEYDNYEDNEVLKKEESIQYNFEIEETVEERQSREKEKIVETSPERLDYIITEEILKVIENYTDFASVQATVKEATTAIGRNNVEVMKDYLKGRVAKPQRMKMKYEELGQWARTVENAVLTIIYGFEEYGVDELLKISVMPSEISYKAINLLCKLAAKDIERQKIIDSIIYIMKPLREEEVIRVLNFLSQIKNSTKIDKLLELFYRKYLLENNLEFAYDTAINRINLRGSYIEEELTFFKVLALYDGKLEADLILKGEKGIIDFTRLEEDIKVKAAVSYYSLNKDDREINYRLLYLKDNSLDLKLRKFLSTVIN
ncbi:MAG: hypothetical protein RR192_00370 [Peptostreptococcaceae bacterium]